MVDGYRYPSDAAFSEALELGRLLGEAIYCDLNGSTVEAIRDLPEPVYAEILAHGDAVLAAHLGLDPEDFDRWLIAHDAHQDQPFPIITLTHLRQARAELKQLRRVHTEAVQSERG
jgi:hypothetical protein